MPAQRLARPAIKISPTRKAIDVFRQELEVDPLSAILNYDLRLALKRQGDEAGATQALFLASKIDPKIGHKIRIAPSR